MADSWAQNNEPLYDQAPGQCVVLTHSVNDSVSVNEHTFVMQMITHTHLHHRQKLQLHACEPGSTLLWLCPISWHSHHALAFPHAHGSRYLHVTPGATDALLLTPHIPS